MPDFVRASRSFDRSAGDLWAFVSDPDQLSRWLGPTDLQPVEGRAYTLALKPRPGWSGQVAGEVNWVQPGRAFGFSWKAPELASTTQVFVHVISTPDGSRLEVDHRGFAPLGLRWWLAHRVGWQRLVARLDTLVVR